VPLCSKRWMVKPGRGDEPLRSLLMEPTPSTFAISRLVSGRSQVSGLDKAPTSKGKGFFLAKFLHPLTDWR